MNDLKEVFLTTLSTDNYLPGVLVLAENIKRLCHHEFVVLATNDLKEETYQALDKNNIHVILDEPLKLPDHMIKDTFQKSYFTHWPKTFFKLKIFGLTQFEKIVFLDSDMMLTEGLDDLFLWDHMSATISGRTYPGNDSWHELNSGVLVIVPKEGRTEKLVDIIEEVAIEKEYFGDQDVLNAYYPDWFHLPNLQLPEEYNVFLMYADYYKKNVALPKVIHFIGKQKPWMMSSFELFIFYIKYILRGRFYGIKMMQQYRKLLNSI